MGLRRGRASKVVGVYFLYMLENANCSLNIVGNKSQSINQSINQSNTFCPTFLVITQLSRNAGQIPGIFSVHVQSFLLILPSEEFDI